MIQKKKNNSNPTNGRTPYLAKFLDPVEIIAQLKIEPGMKVAHFGCGSGFFTFPIAEKIGESGEIYAFDILKEKIETIASRAKLEGYGNIFPRRANLEKENGSKLENESMDWVILVNMLFQNTNKKQVIAEAKRILKKGGHVLLIDWGEVSGSIGPDPKNRVAKRDLVGLIRKFSLGIEREIEASDFHFGMEIIKNN
jgi:ubiquinone/menaquinone biosynthesis C-methylase UbiE